MIMPGKVLLVAAPVVLAFVWPFTGTETVMVMASIGAMAATIIGALKSTAAEKSSAVAVATAEQTKLAVNGHLAKLEKEQDKSKSDRDAEFNRLLQVVKDASRAEGVEIARKEAELLAIKVAEGVAQKSALPAAPVQPQAKV